ncbi:MAG: universal stress protein [Pseudomonadota bacterium]
MMTYMAAENDNRIKFLVLVSDAPEARRTAFFTGRRAKRSNAAVTLLHVLSRPEFGHWATVTETMREEIRERGEALMREFSAEIETQSGEVPEKLIVEGEPIEEIRKLIEQDSAIAILFLGASSDEKDPGPIVSALAGKPSNLGSRPIPVTIVPGSITRDELRELAG